MQAFRTKSPMENTYDESIRDTIEIGVCIEVLYDDVPYAYYYGHDVNFHFNHSIGVRVKLLYDDVPFECFYGKKAYVTPSMLNITVDESESIIIPLSKVKFIKIKNSKEDYINADI